MHRFAVLSTTIVGIVGLALLHVAPARPAGGCSVASAPVIPSGAAQTSDPNACPDGREYWGMAMMIGDTLNVTIAPSAGSHIDFAVYGPDVQTIGGLLCEQAYSGPDKLSCLIPAAGRYVLVTTGPGAFTPVVAGVPAQGGRVAGACDAATAPIVRAGVTQYANSNLCEPSGPSQYWAIELRRGDTLRVNIAPFGPFGASISLGVYGPNVGTIGIPRCAQGYSGPGQLTCPIQRDGRYILATAHAGSCTPLVAHPAGTPPTGSATGTVLVNGAPFTVGPIPYGSNVDVTNGTLDMSTEAGHLTVFGGAGLTSKFQLVRANAKKLPLVELRLIGGNFSSCGSRALARQETTGKPIRRLWGKGKGRFRTKGRFSTVSVRGTTWLTEDRCDGTLTFVRQGVVSVYDQVKKKTITVRAGRRYLAKPKK